VFVGRRDAPCCEFVDHVPDADVRSRRMQQRDASIAVSVKT